jgi:hypothetical protein
VSPEGEALITRIRAWLQEFELGRVTEIDFYDRTSKEIDSYMDTSVMHDELNPEDPSKSD